MRGERQRGFSMIEVLITLVIIATALLGTAGLQLYAMKMGKSGDFRTQAVFLTNDLFERMEANENASVLGAYALALTDVSSAVNTVDCIGSTCDATTLATWDIREWINAIADTGLPQAKCRVEALVVGNPATYRVFIQWTDRSTSASAVSETFSYTATRSIRRDDSNV